MINWRTTIFYNVTIQLIFAAPNHIFEFWIIPTQILWYHTAKYIQTEATCAPFPKWHIQSPNFWLRMSDEVEMTTSILPIEEVCWSDMIRYCNNLNNLLVDV